MVETVCDNINEYNITTAAEFVERKYVHKNYLKTYNSITEGTVDNIYLFPGVSESDYRLDMQYREIILMLKESNMEKERELISMKKTLGNSIPKYASIYLVVNAIIATLCLTILGYRFLFGIYTIDPYYAICGLIISLGLFFTAIATVKDWKDYINGTKKERRRD